MNTTDIIITRGIVACRSLEKEFVICIKYLFAALTPEARRRLKGTFSDSEIKMLEQFVAEQYTQAEKNGYKVETEKTKPKK